MTSGTTKGTCSCMRKAELSSITTAPEATARRAQTPAYVATDRYESDIHPGKRLFSGLLDHQLLFAKGTPVGPPIGWKLTP